MTRNSQAIEPTLEALLDGIQQPIMMTGGAVTERARQFVERAPYILNKPFELEALESLLAEVIARPR